MNNKNLVDLERFQNHIYEVATESKELIDSDSTICVSLYGNFEDERKIFSINKNAPVRQPVSGVGTGLMLCALIPEKVNSEYSITDFTGYKIRITKED